MVILAPAPAREKTGEKVLEDEGLDGVSKPRPGTPRAFEIGAVINKALKAAGLMKG